MMNVESASVIGIKFIQFEAGIRILNEAINQSEERMLPPIEIRDAGGKPVFGSPVILCLLQQYKYKFLTFLAW